MSRIFISGSTTGLGLMAGELLASQSHRVVLHARNAERAEDARRALPKAEAVVIGDVETIAGAKDIASQANALGRFDAVIHNAAVGYHEGHRVTSDGLPHVFAINTLSAYILTALVERPKRLVYLSSGMHHHANANLDDILWKKRRWNGSTAYAESKLHDAMLAFAIARRWPVRLQIGCLTMKAPSIAFATAPSRVLKQWIFRVTMARCAEASPSGSKYSSPR